MKFIRFTSHLNWVSVTYISTPDKDRTRKKSYTPIASTNRFTSPK